MSNDLYSEYVPLAMKILDDRLGKVTHSQSLIYCIYKLLVGKKEGPQTKQYYDLMIEVNLLQAENKIDAAKKKMKQANKFAKTVVPIHKADRQKVYHNHEVEQLIQGDIWASNEGFDPEIDNDLYNEAMEIAESFWYGHPPSILARDKKPQLQFAILAIANGLHWLKTGKFDQEDYDKHLGLYRAYLMNASKQP